MKVTLRKGGILPPGRSRYWREHLSDWRKLRAQREGGDRAVVEVDPVEWCEAHGLAEDNIKSAGKLFLASNKGLIEATDSVSAGRVEVKREMGEADKPKGGKR